MVTNDTRVDTTFIGYFLVGFILLILGVWGLQEGCLFGDSTTLTDYSKLPLDWNVVGQISGAIGILLILFTVFAYRTGKQASAGIFAFFGLYSIFICFNNASKSGISQITANSDWFVILAFAIFFLIIAIYALVAKAPKFVAVLILLAALMTFFFALCCLYGPFGTDNVDLHKAFGTVSGIFGLLGFIISVYLGLAYANPKKVPLI